MKKERFKITSGCPQCGCSQITDMTRDEMIKKYGHIKNIELECNECLAKWEDDIQNACPEWDAECKLAKEK